jgi:apolipoprotein D and lipocalin family protein
MRLFMRLSFSILLLILLAACAASTTKKYQLAPLQTQEKVELDKFMGRWYVIANIPYSAEKDKVGSYVEYSIRPDGRINDYYFFRKHDFNSAIQRWEGVAWVIDQDSKARWKAQFIWPLSFDYLILETAPDYSWAIIGHPSRDLAWVFARTPAMDQALLDSLYAKLSAQGYRDGALKRIVQTAQQLGQPGFQ